MEKEERYYSNGYRITEDGRIISKKGKEIKGSVDNRGYIQISVRHYGKVDKCSAHRLQAFQKYGDSLYSDGIEVRHFNGNRLDNSYANILIGDHSQNMMDIPEAIRIKSALHATSFVRKHDKEQVREFYNKCRSYKKTMDEFNIRSKGTLHYILNGRK